MRKTVLMTEILKNPLPAGISTGQKFSTVTGSISGRNNQKRLQIIKFVLMYRRESILRVIRLSISLIKTVHS